MKSIHVSIRDQRLTLKENETPIRSYPVSTSRFGVGTEEGSMKTPTGRFRVAKKIGEGLPSDTVFQSRAPLQAGDPLPPTEDLVMSRILWLDGLDEQNANTRVRVTALELGACAKKQETMTTSAGTTGYSK